MLNYNLDFTAVVHKLGLWREEAITQLRDPQAHDEALILKRQLDSAIAALELCQRFQIRPDARVTVLPGFSTMSGPSFTEYRLMEDSETENREDWFELEIDGEPVRLAPGDIVLEQQW